MPVSQEFLAYVEDIREWCDNDTRQPTHLDVHRNDLTQYWYADAMYAYRLAHQTI